MGRWFASRLEGREVKKIPKQEYTAEFKEQAARHAQAVGIVVAAKALGLVEQTLRNWVKAVAAGKLTAVGAKPVTPEQMELSRLRAEKARLKMQVDALKQATAYFAKDAL
jgi:transposase